MMELIVLPVYSALASETQSRISEPTPQTNHPFTPPKTSKTRYTIVSTFDLIYRLKEKQDKAVKAGPLMCLSSITLVVKGYRWPSTNDERESEKSLPHLASTAC